MSADILGKIETNAEARFNIALRPRKPLGRKAQDGHLASTFTQLLNSAAIVL